MTPHSCKLPIQVDSLELSKYLLHNLDYKILSYSIVNPTGSSSSCRIVNTPKVISRDGSVKGARWPMLVVALTILLIVCCFRHNLLLMMLEFSFVSRFSDCVVVSANVAVPCWSTSHSWRSSTCLRTLDSYGLCCHSSSSALQSAQMTGAFDSFHHLHYPVYCCCYCCWVFLFPHRADDCLRHLSPGSNSVGTDCSPSNVVFVVLSSMTRTSSDQPVPIIKRIRIAHGI